MTWEKMGEKCDSWTNWWASPRLTLGFGTAICFALCAVLPVTHSISLVLWLLAELAWWFIHRTIFLPKLLSFRPEDAAELISDHDFDRAIDNMVHLLENDSKRFWLRVTGKSLAKVPIETAQSYVQSLLFINHDEVISSDDVAMKSSDNTGGNGEVEIAPSDRGQSARLLKRGLSRIEEANGGFAPSTPSSAVSSMSSEEKSRHIDPTPPHTKHAHSVEEIPNLIQGWGDNKYLSSIVRTTPLVVSLMTLMTGLLLKIVLRLFGWRRGFKDPISKLDYWVLNPNSDSDKPPLVLIPGAGNGLMSFLPLALHFQFKVSSRKIILYRLPHVEVGRPWARLPQWSELVAGLVGGLEKEGVSDFDLIAHSYGTAVANRLLRELCLDRAHQSRLTVGFLALLDPIVFGGASAGLVGVINAQGPDLSFAFCANRAGVTPKEIMDFDPTKYGQCTGRGGRNNISVYLSKDDVLIDVSLAEKILKADLQSAHLEVDETPNSFHGRWLVEMWTGGSFFNFPCSTKALDLLYDGINEPMRKQRKL